mgnify:CR=1 FL=1
MTSPLPGEFFHPDLSKVTVVTSTRRLARALVERFAAGTLDPVALATRADVDVFVELVGGSDGPAKAATVAAAFEVGQRLAKTAMQEAERLDQPVAADHARPLHHLQGSDVFRRRVQGALVSAFEAACQTCQRRQERRSQSSSLKGIILK